jgi:sensor histidine kinase YesM
MFFKKAHSIIPLSRLLKIILILSIGMQLIILSQMYFFKNDIFSEPLRLLIRIFRGTLLSFIAGSLLVYPYLYLIAYLNRRFSWKRKFVKRFSMQFFVVIFSGLLITPLIVVPAGLIFTMEYDLQTNINNAYYIIILSLFLMTILEAMIYFHVSSAATVKAENLEKELSQIRFEVLKSQINPHFMFNSLNVLSGLVDQDVSKAQQFIDEFSSVYRYVLETIEQPVVSLNKELDFTRSYLFLQQIRYGENLSYTISVPSGLLAFVLPPLSLQVVLENITKHNLISDSKPLQISICSEDLFLVVKNNIQAKIAFGQSTGLGLKNLVKRYAFISNLEPTFRIENNYYVAKLPLININDNERTDHRG